MQMNPTDDARQRAAATLAHARLLDWVPPIQHAAAAAAIEQVIAAYQEMDAKAAAKEPAE